MTRSLGFGFNTHNLRFKFKLAFATRTLHYACYAY